MTRSQATPLSPGQYWEMVKALGDKLPKDLGQHGYHQDPAWFNDQVARLVAIDRHSELARQLEAVLAGNAQVQYLEINPYEAERVTPTYFYPKGYRPSSVKEQVKRLLQRYDWLDASHVEVLVKSWGKYEQADGLYVIPKPTSVADHLGIAELWTNFGLLTEQGPFAALAASRKFTNYRSGNLGADRYRLTESAKSALIALEKEQPGDLLVFPAQTGKLFAGLSPRNARWDIEHASNPAQWPLSTYAVGWMLVANPHRLDNFQHLIVDCPGDEYRFGLGEEFDYVLSFRFYDGKLCLGGGWDYAPSSYWGSGSGFVQQSLD